MRVKQEITSLIQNFAWETDPKWQFKMVEIDEKIKHFWEDILERDYPNAYGNKDPQ